MTKCSEEVFFFFLKTTLRGFQNRRQKQATTKLYDPIWYCTFKLVCRQPIKLEEGAATWPPPFFSALFHQHNQTK